MVQLQSVIAKPLQYAAKLFLVKVKTVLNSVRHASRTTKYVLGSAFALAFLIAPAAALMVSGNPSNNLSNADSSNDSTPSVANNNDSSPDSQQPVSNNNADPSNGPDSSSTAVDVNNDSTTVTVNGHTVAGPTTDPVSKTVNSNGTHTTISVQNSSSGSGKTSTFSNKSVHITSHTSTNTESSP